MALKPGFERYEGLAYFGYDPEGEGYEAVAIIGENMIEIRDLSDKTLSIWAPGAYYCNGHPLPKRAYFSGDEWLAPRDEELRAILDRHMEKPSEDKPAPKPARGAQKTLIGLLIGLAIAALAGFYLVNFLTERLLSPAIRGELEKTITEYELGALKICNPEHEELAQGRIAELLPGVRFRVLPNLNARFARLPSGMLAINSAFFERLEDSQTLIALLNLAGAKNSVEDPGAALVRHLGFIHKLRFLALAQVEGEKLIPAWQKHIASESFELALLAEIPMPLGDFDHVGELLDEWPDNEYVINPTEIILDDQQWLALGTFCNAQ